MTPHPRQVAATLARVAHTDSSECTDQNADWQQIGGLHGTASVAVGRSWTSGDRERWGREHFARLSGRPHTSADEEGL